MDVDLDGGDILGIGVAVFLLFVAALVVLEVIPPTPELGRDVTGLAANLPEGTPTAAALPALGGVLAILLTILRKMFR